MKHLQRLANSWAIRAFGIATVSNPKERALRVLEEAIELAQSEGILKHMVDHCADVVYGRPIGLANQEIGGVLVTTAVYCSCHNLDMEEVFIQELDRILSKPLEHFAKRFQEKIDLGLAIDR